MTHQIGSLEVIQFNAHKRGDCNLEVVEWMMNRNNSVALLQEPGQRSGRILNIDSRYIRCITGIDDMNNSTERKPRACILLKNKINALRLSQFSDADQVAVLIKDLNDMNIVLTSIYMPYNSRQPPPSQLTKDLVNFCEQHNWKLIIGSDANSHNVMWGSSDDNSRGEHLLEYIVSTSLEICNVGNSPTFIVANRQEIIDVTLATMNIMDHINNWQVIGDMKSDHRPITFDVVGEYESHSDTYRNIRKTRWDKYKRELNSQMGNVDINNDNLDDLTGLMNEAITKAYHESCKERKKSGKNKPEWWNENLTRLKREAGKARKKYLRQPNEENRIDKNRTEHSYRNELAKVKSQSWREYCSRTEDITAVAKLHKLMKNGRMAEIGTLRKSDGTYTTTTAETLTELLDVLLPVKEHDEQHNVDNFFNQGNTTLTEEILGGIINDTTVRAAVKKFDPYKSPGTDGIYPALLQKGIDTLLPFLVKIFRLSLKSGRLSKHWLTIKTVFIPKPGKTDYTVAKSYRPISLMSFVVKTLERLLLWHVQDAHMTRFPLPKNVYAYREGVSTESALHRIVYRIEKALAEKEFALAVFLDIDGAFSNTSTESMVRALASKGVEVEIVHWLNDLLSNRTAITQLGSEKVEREVEDGAAQGGVFSPPVFNNVGAESVEAVPDRPDQEGHVFADDVNVIASGDDELELGENMQEALDCQVEWSKSHGLNFNPSKTKAMLFTKKINFAYPALNLDGIPIEYVETFKYLGVTLDTKLSWKKHIKAQVKKAKASLMIGRKMIGKKWGLNPKVTHWLYTAIVRPMLTYGAVVWVNCLDKKGLTNELRKVQRLALKMITGCMHSTPTAGMETLLGIAPIEETIKAAALSTCVRLHNTGYWIDTEGKTEFKSHVKTLDDIRVTIPELHFPQDRLIFKARIENSFTVRIGDRKEMTSSKIRPMPFDPGKVNVFTDGSKDEVSSGAAYFIRGHSIRKQEYFNLGEYTTVFQAEITAISTASQAILEEEIQNEQINFYIDSKSAISALSGYIVQNKCVAECKRHLNKLCEYGNTVRLNWIPGHADQKGNEIADRLAKRGADMCTVGVTPVIPISKCVITHVIEEWMKAEHERVWVNRHDCRQSRLVLPTTRHRWKGILKRDKDDIRLLTQLVTGHANLGYHRFLMSLEDSPDCSCGETQTAIHILTECPNLAGYRMMILGRPIVNIEDICKYNFDRILKLARQTDHWDY